jgi:outer membrane receptor protein involved in Fe transport
MQGWIHNDAGSIADPFFTAAQPAAAAIIPAPAHGRVGDSDLLGRFTLLYEPSSDFKLTFKAFASHGRDQGNGSTAQNIGPCSGPSPRAFGIPDPFGECKIDNHVSLGSLSPVVTSTSPRGPKDGQPYGETNALFLTLNGSWNVGWGTLSSTTGYSRVRADSASSLDYTVFSGLYKIDSAIAKSFSQELRLLSDFDGPLNFMVGAYYQNSSDKLYDDFWALRNSVFNPANGRYTLAERNGFIKGNAYSAFGQLIWKLTPEIELAGGARYTSERKRTSQANVYGRNSSLGNYDTLAFVFPSSLDPTPGVLAGRFKDDNVSPEVTLTWHPQPNATLYVAYKTGFKSGGFGISSALSRATTLGDIDFGSEKVKGFEAGAKGEFLDRRLRITSSIFAYNFSNLQVNSFDAVNVRYVINNAGGLRQRGADLEVSFQAIPALRLRSAIAYVHNRFRNYVGQCYAFPIPAAAAQTTPAPPGCSFLLNSSGGRALAANGTPILQQVFSGRAPARSPDWSGSAGFDYTVPLGSLDFRVSGDAFYTGKYYASETMAPSTLQRGFWRLNASASLASDASGWELSVVGRNLTNKYYLSYAADRTGGTSVPLVIGEQRGVVARGREIAVQASFNF